MYCQLVVFEQIWTIDATYAVAAAVHVQVGWQCDTSDEGEDDVQDVKRDWHGPVEDEGVPDGGWDQVDECEHAPGADEHAVGDDGWSRGDGFHVTDKSEDEENPEELKPKSVYHLHSPYFRIHTSEPRKMRFVNLIPSIAKVFAGVVLD